MTSKHATAGILIVGHGTRNGQGAAEFRQLVDDFAANTDVPVEAAYIELQAPLIGAGLQSLVDRGARKIALVPLLLFAAGHARRDIPAAVAEFAEQHPDIPIQTAGAIDCAAEIVELSQRRYDDIRTVEVPPSESTLVLIARGNSDLDAQAEFRRFAERRLLTTPVEQVICGYVAIAEPSLSSVLEQAANGAARRIVVQPHLLFAGEVLEQIRAAVEPYRSQCPEKSWEVAEHLQGGPELLAYLRRVAAEMLI